MQLFITKLAIVLLKLSKLLHRWLWVQNLLRVKIWLLRVLSKCLNLSQLSHAFIHLRGFLLIALIILIIFRYFIHIYKSFLEQLKYFHTWYDSKLMISIFNAINKSRLFFFQFSIVLLQIIQVIFHFLKALLPLINCLLNVPQAFEFTFVNIHSACQNILIELPLLIKLYLSLVK